MNNKALQILNDMGGAVQGGGMERLLVDVGKYMIKQEQVNCPVVHRFGPGIYIREVFLPGDTFAIGHRQKKEHLNIFLKGRVTILKPDGTTEELNAPMIFTGQPGRKCGYIHEDVVWLNVYPTDERDIEKLEEMFLDKSGIEPEEVKKIYRKADIADYYSLISEYGYTEERVRAEAENQDDQIPFPDGAVGVQVGSSDIEGNGLMATSNFKKGETIAPGRLGGMRTPAGRYTNHSINPNAEPRQYGNGDIYLVALRDIEGMRGGQLGEEITINYRTALELKFRRQGPCQG